MPLRAQVAGSALDWDSFAEEYFGREEEEAVDAELYERLEEIALSPLNLNTASREELLQLPFLPPEAADSLLSYRSRVGRLLSMGDLMLLRGFDFSLRRYLSLFTYVGKPEPLRATRREMWLGGKTEVETRLDLPLYRREGDRNLREGETVAGNNSVFLGQSIGGVVRYRYKWRHQLRYGFTLQQDAGEPFFSHGNRPFDYASFYAYYSPRSRRYDLLLGDFRAAWGQGLTMGHGFLASPAALIDASRRTPVLFSPHTSSEENNFLRGAAVYFRRGAWRLGVFGSYRTLDARMEGDTIRSLLTTGLHRTPVEMSRKDATSQYLLGAHLGTGGEAWDVGLGTYYAHYADPISPEPRHYNRYYLRGQDIAALSAHWNLRQLRRFSLAGELAADRSMHLALTNTLRYQPQDELELVLQHRNFSPRFVAPFGKAFAVASRVANEHGFFLGLRYSGWGRFDLRAYGDYAFFPEATYYSRTSSHSLTLSAEGRYSTAGGFSLLLRYRVKSRQRDLSSGDGQEWDYRHRIRLQASQQWGAWDLCSTVEASLAGRQSRDDAFGFLLALRAAYRPSARLTLKGFAALFFTDDYASAVYAYEPRLLHTFGSSAFFYHGLRCSALADWHLLPSLTLSARAGLLRRFNHPTSGTGPDLITTGTRPELSLQLRYFGNLFPAQK